MFVGSTLVSGGISISGSIGIAVPTGRTAFGIPIRHVRGDAEPAPLQSPIVTAKLLGEHSLHIAPGERLMRGLELQGHETIHLAHGDFAIAIHIKPWSPQTAIIRKSDYRQAISGIHMLHD